MLPILISTPHSSAHVPHWLLARMLRTGEERSALERRLFKEGDPFTDLIFDVPDAAATVNAAASRFVADPNRARSEGGENGVIKLTDFERRPFFPTRYVVTPEEREARLTQYYDPFHTALARVLASGSIRFFIDGHSMTARGPAIGPDEGDPRPALCIGNFGDADGDPAAGPLSCPGPMARGIRDHMAESLRDVIAASGLEAPALNSPFDGGHVLRRYSAAPFSVPGVMIEVNRALYLDEESLRPLPGRIEALSKAVQRLAAWVAESLP
ncbi:MAG: N-formylglutamate amidohydrolase [Fibrobacteres bacterium]|jgi:N-formylglutamate deformylase|nr:N-formylglutamate amidohydrolase [Fibrobacterota bacterium]